MNKIKEFILSECDKMYEEILPFCKELEPQKELVKILQENNFEILKRNCELGDYFIAYYDNFEDGPNIAFIGEYASSSTDQAQNQNLAIINAVASGITLSKAMKEYNLGGKVTVLCTPTEENSSEKMQVIRKCDLKNVDYAILMHPANESTPNDASNSSVNLEYTFRKPDNSVAFPHIESSALEGVMHMFNLFDAISPITKDSAIVQVKVKEGAFSTNIVPDRATSVFSIRAVKYDYLLELIKVFDKFANIAATSTGLMVEKKDLDRAIKNIQKSRLMVDFIRENMDLIGEEYIERTLDQEIESTNMRNITHGIPTIKYSMRLGDDKSSVLKKFGKSADESRRERCLKQSIKVSSLTGYDLIDQYEE